MQECDEVPIGERFDLAQNSQRLILTYVDLAKLTTEEFIPSKSMHYLTYLYFSGVFKNLHTMFDFYEKVTIFKCLGDKNTQDFLLVTPIKGLG